MIRATMEAPAWRELSTAAQALYPWLKLEWKGLDFNNNGRIRLSVRQAAERLGVSINTAAEAFRDLQRKGFLVVTEPATLGVEGEARSPAYEITELKLPGSDQPDGRKLYRDWRPGHDFPVNKASVHNPDGNRRKKPCLKNCDDPVLKTDTKQTDPVLKTDTPCLKNCDVQAEPRGTFVSISKTSLACHTGAPSIPPRGGGDGG